MDRWQIITRVRSRRFWSGRFIIAAALLGLGAACDALWVEDVPRPTLDPADRFDVSPTCPVLPLDTNAIAAVEPTIALSGVRRGTHAGAEAVSVAVYIGHCGEPDASDGAAVSSMVSDTDADAPNLCSAALQAVRLEDLAAFELVGTATCEEKSATRLDCLLDSNGQAAFKVRSVGATSDSRELLQEYLPICVSPVMRTGSGDREIRVLPRARNGRLDTAIVNLATFTSAGGDGGSCASLSDCTGPTPRGRFVAGVTGSDTPPRDLREEDLVPLLHSVNLSLSISPSSPDVFLTTGDSCASDAGKISGPLSIEQGKNQTVPFILCSPAATNNFQLSATLFVKNPDAGPDLTPTGIDIRTKNFPARPVVRSYSLGSDGISATACDGTTALAPNGDFGALPVPCRVDGGDTSEGGATPTCTTTLTLAAGGTCTL